MPLIILENSYEKNRNARTPTIGQRETKALKLQHILFSFYKDIVKGNRYNDNTYLPQSSFAN